MTATRSCEMSVRYHQNTPRQISKYCNISKVRYEDVRKESTERNSGNKMNNAIEMCGKRGGE
jgi:hypothetical protein